MGRLSLSGRAASSARALPPSSLSSFSSVFPRSFLIRRKSHIPLRSKTSLPDVISGYNIVVSFSHYPLIPLLAIP